MTTWIELHIKTNADYANLLSDQLALFGAEAVTFHDAGNQPIYEPEPGTVNLWQETIVVGLFDAKTSLKSILFYLEREQASGLISQFSLKPLADKDWERVCLEHFKPLHLGKRLWIIPSWQTPPDLNAVNVILDPGLAFGTGTHPTTALCLRWLDQHVTNQQLVIDYGCGSGILGIAAVKLGAKQVIAIDNDPQALQATGNNGNRNQLSAPVLTTYLPQDFPTATPLADLLIANILAQPLIELAPNFAKLVQKGGLILLSGILNEQIDAIKTAYSPCFDLNEVKIEGEWALLAGFLK